MADDDAPPARFHQPVVAPTRLRAEHFVLEPLGPQHNAADHAAWSASIEHIRSTPGFVPEAWGGDRWPYPMSAEDNLADLVQHATEFAAGDAFAYTVLDPADGDVVGCVYVDPDETGEAECQCRSWVRVDRAPLDGELAAAVDAWLRGPDWPFRSVRWPGRHLHGAPDPGHRG